MSLLETMSPYKDHASWAIWETSNGELTGRAEFPTAQLDEIHGDAMIVSLNPATLRTPSRESSTQNWANFHNPHRRHNDMFLATALHGTRYWGSYMVDLHPGLAESRSHLVNPEREVISDSVDLLIEQAQLLKSAHVVICVGRKSFASVSMFAARIHESLGPTSIIGIPHYSGAAARVHGGDPTKYRAVVHASLGIEQ